LALKPLRDAKEGRVARQHEPARIEAGAARVPDQTVEHLRDAAAGSGRADVPHDLAREPPPELAGAYDQLLELPLVDNTAKRLESHRRGLHFFQIRHVISHR